MLIKHNHLHNLSGLIISVLLFVSCQQTVKQSNRKIGKPQLKSSIRFPIQKLEDKCESLLVDTTKFKSLKVDTSSVLSIASSEMFSPASFQLFRFKLFNSANYVNNYGQINGIALVSKVDSNDLRILFYEPYANSSTDFFEPYLNTVVSNKIDYCTRLASLICKNISHQKENIEFAHSQKGDSLLVVSKCKIEYSHLFNEDKEIYVKVDSVKFIFNKNKLLYFVKNTGI